MEIRVRATPLGGHRDEAAVLFVAKDENASKTVAAAGAAFAAPYATLVSREVFLGEKGQVAVLGGAARAHIATLVVVGIGGKADEDAETLRLCGAMGVRAARDAGARSVTLVVPTGSGAWLRADRAAQALAEGALVGLYRFQAHKTEKAKTDVDTLTFLAPRGESKRVEKGVHAGEGVAAGVCLARDLGNQPGNVATPSYLGEVARGLAEEHGLKARIFDEDEMRKMGMGALLGVSQGSAEPAKLIVLTYEPKRRGRVDTIALVGKGLTFDAGGISIKPSPKMEDMKFDMCGGAAVLGTMKTIGMLGAPVRVVAVVPASENLLGAAAYKPGDILKAMNGVTIEIRNTDAEGRLILADALSWVSAKLRPKPKVVIDMATLTGACVVALGDQHAGLMGNDERLAGQLEDAASASGDAVWRLPLTRRIPQATRESLRRRGQHRKPWCWYHHGLRVPREVHGRHSVGSRRYRGNGLDGQGRRIPQQGRNGVRRAAPQPLRTGLEG